MQRIKRQQRSFADLELESQGIRLEAELAAISRLLDRSSPLLEAVARDLRHGLMKPDRGRDGMSAEQALRSLVLKQIKNWSFRELRERIADGITLREFTRFGAAAVPKHKAFHRASTRLKPETLRAVNAAVVDLAIALGVEDARKIRMDTTVSETDIHFPTDSGLLWDSVRVLTRCAARILEEIPELPERLFNRTRSARRRMQEIHRLTRSQRQYLQVPKYRELITVTNQVLDNVRAVAKAAGAVVPQLEFEVGLRVEALCGEIRHYAELGERVIAQARRRVLGGESVPAGEKLYSIFEPHTDLIKRGKTQKPVEFGHKVFLAETRRGLVLDYWVLEGNPTDDVNVAPWLARHRERFGVAPDVAAGDRGFYSATNIEALRAGGVGLECLPQRGGRKTAERAAYEKSRRFKQGQKFRAGIEGRISVLVRGRGMKRCRLKGTERFELFIGLVVLANNLLVIGRHLDGKRRHKLAA
jgi:transposase, IS5 family